jgi:hypothetical protein
MSENPRDSGVGKARVVHYSGNTGKARSTDGPGGPKPASKAANGAHPKERNMTDQRELDVTDNLGGGSAGSVYVFNVASQDLNLSTNGAPTSGGTIPAWGMSGGSKYQPSGQAVPRMLNASDGPGNFFNGTNSLALQWPEGLSLASVNIDASEFPLNQDLLLIVERNQWQLVNQYAVQVTSGEVILAGFDAAGA